MKDVLFTYRNKNIGKQEILSSLKIIGIKPGDDLFVHSDIRTIGKVIKGLSLEKLANIIIDILQEAIFPGTLIFPTFTYSFCKKEYYNPQKTLSTVGSLTNLFWQRKNCSRSLHPIFSVAAIGKSADYFTQIEKKVCFDKGSFFGKLVARNVKIIGFGVKLIPTLTFLHHIEESNSVPYRYNKKFSGNIVLKTVKIHQTYTYFVRNLKLNPELKFRKIENFLIRKNLIRSLDLGAAKIELIESKKVFQALSQKIKKDPFWMIKLKPS